jgi:predicted metalloendopeptidase
MDTKLTLKLDKDTIEKAKRFAKKRHLSLSKIVERFFKSLSEKEGIESKQYSPLVKELSGIISLEKDEDMKEKYAEYLVEKYR